MVDGIQPALSAEEWAEAEEMQDAVAYHAGLGRPAAAIALLNDSLPDSDRRKITRETIALLRAAVNRAEIWDAEMDAAWAFAAALESYLPPERP